MKLLTKAILKKLPKLYETENVPAEEKVAVVKFFNPAGSGTWYGVEFDGEDTFFGYVAGLCPDGDEWGYFSLAELASLRLPFGLKIERDLYWKPTKMGEVLSGKAM
jgi:hypothetical protein